MPTQRAAGRERGSRVICRLRWRSRRTARDTRSPTARPCRSKRRIPHRIRRGSRCEIFAFFMDKMSNKKERIDLLVTQRGLAASRERARALILAGRVLANEQKVEKPGTIVAADAA